MPKLTITNLTNSPYDLEGGVRLPAMGIVTEEFTDSYAALLRASPGIEVSEALHDAAGFDALSDAELRDLVEKETGKKPHPAAKRETLIEKLEATNG
ncbi:hypothetical protein GCM10007897_44570 [Sphingobium jiangsuense]|uniref:Uncharacterized protein n=1 Tax=Sphingobium jiangsuense TaxID=870476 RepID=A0A7W6BMV3_9SPHN|nr:hypothetical protein [Sphingobium jiangsuense]MBB3927831.1 hypothetical protein [Sphingobium jiangsuense]GLT03018.1 hypothetical protein GCM10007897_44570 [Sphingobium jiangsuense]